ncbi:MAG: 50S ribosomal protein L22 [Chitinophagaceae bacterium]
MEAVAKLSNNPTSPRKMRLLADLIRGMEVNKALGVLKHHPKHSSIPLEKLLLSAINNWEQKNGGSKVEDAGLYVKRITVDGGATLKRLRPAPQGRGYRIRKRSNHVMIVVDSKEVVEDTIQPVVETEEKAEDTTIQQPVEKPAKSSKTKKEKQAAAEEK